MHSTPSRPIYLDHAATTRPTAEVVDTCARVMEDGFGNPSSSHRFGRAARRRLDDAHEFLRGSVGAASLVLTSGGTEADLLGVVGAATARPPGRVLAAASDHVAVLALRPLLAARRHELVELPVTADGDVDPQVLFDKLGQDVRVVSILHGHNELGTLARLDELVELVRRVAPDAHVHVDLVQSYGKIDFDLDLADVDSIAVSGHKLHGPRGVGFLALSSKAKLAPLQTGGGQEQGLRGGTENVAGAAGLACAAEWMLSHLAEHAAHARALCERALAQVRAAFPDAHRLGAEGRRLPHILSLRIPGVIGHTLQERCDERGVAFSTGAACHSGQDTESHVMRAIGMSKAAAREVVRISVGPHTTNDEIDAAMRILCEEAEMLLDLAPSPRGARLRTGHDSHG